MKHLMIRKHVLCMLVGFVMALGMAGIADAVQEPSFSQSEANIIAFYRVGGSAIVPDPSTTLTNPTKIEKVTISKSGGVVFTSQDTGKSSVVFEEVDETPDDNTNGSITTRAVNIRFTSAGRRTVTIKGTAYAADPNNADSYLKDEDWSFTYIYYVTDHVTNPTRTVSLTGLNLRNGYATGYYSDADLKIHTGSGSYPVNYSPLTNLEIHLSAADIKYLSDATDDGVISLVGRTVPVSSAFNVYLYEEAADESQTITATVQDAQVSTTAVYIYGFPTLTVGYPNDPDGNPATDPPPTGAGSKADPESINATIDNAFTALVTDSTNTDTNPNPSATPNGAVGGIVVRFQVNGGGDAGGWLVFKDDSVGILVDSNNRKKTIEEETATTLYVRTDTGKASVSFQLGTNGKQDVTVSAVGQSERVSVYADVPGAGKELVNPRSASRAGKYDLRVNVEEDGEPFTTGVGVEFTTSDGTLDTTDTARQLTRDTNGRRLTVTPDSRGVAFVIFDPDEDSGSLTVTVRLWDLGDGDAVGGINGEADTLLAETVINVRGGSRDQAPQNQNQFTTPTLTLSPTTFTGSSGASPQFIATVRDASGNPLSSVVVQFRLNGVVVSESQTNTSGIAVATINLFTGGTLTASWSNYSDTATISLTGTTDDGDDDEEETVSEPASIEIYDGDEQQGEINRRLDEDLAVEVLDNNNRGVSFEIINLSVVEGSGRFSPTRPRTDRNGRAYFSFTPRSPGSQGTIEIEAAVGDLSPVTFTVNVGEPPDAIKKISGDNQSGRPGTALANPFVVEVVDENDDPVSGTTVTFAVTAGGGSVSPTSATTNANGRAQTTLTLGDAVGDNTVSASVTGLPAVTFTATSGAQVLVRAAQRPPMYWVGKTNGTLHRLVGADTENLAPNVQGVTSIAVDSANGYLYFAVQTGANKGTIRRAGLNGTGAQTLKKLTAVPMGIAVDSAGGTVYWTNSRGRIQSMAAEGSTQLTNVLQNLSSPGAIALSNGYLYWGEATGRVRRMSLTADDPAPENLATGLGKPLSIAIAKGKIYWVERSAGGGGSLQRANLNGSSIQELKTFASGVPTSIAVDSSDNKIFWTRGTGKIQRSNLMGRFVTDIATGLMNPGSIALGTVAVDDEPADDPGTQQRQQRQQTTQTTDDSKYDVNDDGAVNNIDLTLVAIALGTNNAKYDVNGDGTVNADDVRAVSDAISDDAAAPAIDVDLTKLDLDFDRIQEQIEILLASGDLSLAGQRTLMYLQHLLASARPHETVLLANYPNPFNPETWIPYHLASSADVKINIYNAQGTLVRALTLGHQTAGYYTSRSRAAYWDGRNALGERVASGIYFYQLQADEISPMRKMVILK